MRKAFALLLLSAVSACGGGSANAGSFAPTNPIPNAQSKVLRSHAGTGIFANIVGVGDSLTAGYQSGGFLGALNVKNPLDPGKILPLHMIPPGQESGFWADLYEQATGFSPQAMYKPQLSPLPLIAGPGLDNQVVDSPTTAFGVSKSGNACEFDSGFNQAAFSLTGLSRVRLNAHSSLVRDLAVPGITLHEAAHMTQPLTPTCNALPGTAGLLSEVTNDESGTYYAVLGDFAPRLNQNLSMVEAAQVLQPSLVTIWLGANDVLKFMGSGGQFHGGDMTAAQAQADLEPMIRGFQKNNAKVVIANLPDVLLTAYFMNVDIPKNTAPGSRKAACAINQYFYCLLVAFGHPAPDAAKITAEVRAKYHLEPNYRCVKASVTQPCGYVTLPGALAIVAALASLPPNPIPNLDPRGPGSGLGANYITPEFAGRIQTINNNINAGIEASARNTGAPLVDVRAVFQGVTSGDPSNQYFAKAQLNPGICCTETFPKGGLVSDDGLHPSNTGYALISYYFIQTINNAYRAYGAHVPETPIKAIYSGKPPYAFADPYANQ